MASKNKKQSGFRKFLRILFRVFLTLFFLHLAYVILLKWVMPPITITQFVSILEGDGCDQTNRTLKQISQHAGLAVIAAEDQLFPEHNGFDWESIEKAMESNSKNKKRFRGASTISQQTAKNVFLWQGRSWFRKGLEAYCTLLIEWIWGKERILEVYLNVAQTGEGIYGIESAAQVYFKKPASKLSIKEASMIAACLPNPVRYKVSSPGSYIRRRSGWIQQQMRNLDDDLKIRLLMKSFH